MKFRPCIDIHNGMVKQIVGSSLSMDGKNAKENFVSRLSAADFAEKYKKDGLTGGHVIKLSGAFEDEKAAISALGAYPGGLQIGGGINNTNCVKYLEAGASHVIVTSWIVSENGINFERLGELVSLCGKEHIVLDFSCKKTDVGNYFVAVNRWQTITNVQVTDDFLAEMSEYCDEFLIHGISNEGLKKGPDCELVKIISASPIPVTYAGGISTIEDISLVKSFGNGKVDYTIGSALDIFGGNLKYSDVLKF